MVKLIAVHALSNRKLNYSVDHYIDTIACTYISYILVLHL